MSFCCVDHGPECTDDLCPIMPIGLWWNKEGKCYNCGKRPGVINWVGNGGVLAIVHDHVQKWCEICALTVQLEHARNLAAAIPDLEKKLEEAKGRAIAEDALEVFRKELDKS